MNTGKLKIGSIALLSVLLFAGCGGSTEPSSATTDHEAWKVPVRAEIDNIIRYTPAADMQEICTMLATGDLVTTEEIAERLEPIMARSYDLTAPLADYLGTSPELAAEIPPGTEVGNTIPLFAAAYYDTCANPVA